MPIAQPNSEPSYYVLSPFSICRPAQPYAASGQQLQVLERPGWKEAAQPATSPRVDAPCVGSALGPCPPEWPSTPCWDVSLLASPAQSPRASMPSHSCFCSTPSVHMSVHTEKDILADRWLHQCFWPITLSGWTETERRTAKCTHSILMNYLCLFGMGGVAGQVTWLRETPQRPPGEAFVPFLPHGFSLCVRLADVSVWGTTENCWFTDQSYTDWLLQYSGVP